MGSNMESKVIRANERKTRQGAADSFVGTVLQDPVFAPDSGSGTRVTRVTFTPGARTNWHAHASGQVLYVVSGVGRYQLDGEPVQEIKPGDTVVIPPNARHWHGAAPDNMMVHLAYSNLMLDLASSQSVPDLTATHWSEPVSDKDYNASPA